MPDEPVLPPPNPEREWAIQAKAEANAKHPNDPVAAQWAYRDMVMARAQSRSAPRPAN